MPSDPGLIIRSDAGEQPSLDRVSYRGGGILVTMHDRSRMIIDPRIPTAPGWSMSRFHLPARQRWH